MLIYPVIHHLDRETSLAEALLARSCGADGVFLISHIGEDDEIVEVAAEIKEYMPNFSIGINLLSKSPVTACVKACEHNLDMVWADYMGVTSGKEEPLAQCLADFARQHPGIKLFASVAFKYQSLEPMPALAALKAKRLGFIPTTSGSATGKAPDLKKIEVMSLTTEGCLAVASGMTPENIGDFFPYLSHVLVSTGVSKNEYSLDPDKLRDFIRNAKQNIIN